MLINRQILVMFLIIVFLATGRIARIGFAQEAGSDIHPTRSATAPATTRPAPGAREFEPIPRVEFQGGDIRNVLKMVSDATGMSVFVSPSVDVFIDIWAIDIDPMQLLDRATTIGGVAYFIKDSTINVVTWDEYQEQFGLSKKIIRPRYMTSDELADALTPFLTTKGVVLATPNNALVVLETAPALEKIEEMVRALDVEGVEPAMKVIRLRHAKASTLADSIDKLFESQTPAPRAQNSGASRSSAPELRTASAAPAAANTSGTSGSPPRVPQRPRPQPATSASAGSAQAGARTLIGARGRVVLIPDERTNSLVIKAHLDDMAMIERLVRELDVEISESPVSIRVYRLENTNAPSVAKAITDLMGVRGPGAERAADGVGPAGPGGIRPAMPDTTSTRGVRRYEPPAPLPGQLPKSPPSARPDAQPRAAEPTAGAPGDEKPVGILSTQPMVTINEETNSVVVLATSEQHKEIASLIEELDRPRPQVMIEAIVVQIATDDRLDFGVELEAANFNDTSHRILTSFGLTRINPVTGERTFIPSSGFNTAIIRPDYIPLVVKALQQATNTRISSAPRLLVNDNAAGNIESVQEEPFTSTNIVETDVATTSFAGYATAGTTLTVTPHISDSNFIRLKYQVALNSFTRETALIGVPPPRASNTLASEAVVPDGHTIVVGGLRTTSDQIDKRGVPFLADIPLLGLLFSSSSKQNKNVTLFVFIRPTILRERQFEVLKYISARDVQDAGIAGDFPANDIKTMGTPHLKE